MSVDWRGLFSELDVTWRDRGANCSRGRINIRCPWCGEDDPSFHLTIDEEGGGYYCFRQPQTHRGRSLPWLLRGLHVASARVDALLAHYARDHKQNETHTQKTPQREHPYNWDRFDSAAQYPTAVEYLRGRGYRDPAGLCRDFDLRFTKTGRMSWRVLLPLTAGNDVTGVTGRTITNDSVRYFTDDPYDGSLYLPHGVVVTRVLMVFEGPLDALTIARIVRPDEVVPAALLGLAVPPSRLLTLTGIARHAEQMIYVQDGDQPRSNVYRLIRELDKVRAVAKMDVLRRVSSPAGSKDVGELAAQEGELRRWLDTILSGRESSRTTAEITSGDTTGA
jgi:hypothetical protein